MQLLGDRINRFRWLQDKPVDAFAFQQINIIYAALYLSVTITDQQAVLVEAGVSLDTDRQFGIKWIEHISIDQPNRMSFFCNQ